MSLMRRWLLPHGARVLLWLALLVVMPVLSVSAHTPDSSPAPAPRQGPGNQGTLGSRESGLYLDYTVTGVDLGALAAEGAGNHYAEGTVTASVVQIQGTLYNAMGPNLVTRPSMQAKIGSSMQDCSNGGIVSWPPPEMVDAEGYLGGPFEQELPFSFSYEVQPGDSAVCFSLQTGKSGGIYEGYGVSGWAYVAPDTPAAEEEATPTPTNPPPTPAFKPPCEEPLHFYPGQDFSAFYTGQPSLHYTRDELVNDLLRGVQRYAAMAGARLEDGARAQDVADMAMTFTSDSTLPEGKAVAPALQTAARELARTKQAADPAYRMSPGELLELSLQLNNGNLRNALVTCHAALYRDEALVNKDFVEQEGILAPLRNPEGYADTEWSYTTPFGSQRTVNPRQAIATDQQGPWYHLFGMTALEYTDGYGAASYYGAQVGIWLIGDTSKKDALQKVRDKGMPVTGMGDVLGDLANALEEGIRSRAGKSPDIDKICVNYWALKAGHEMRRWMNSPELVSPPVDDWTPTGKFRPDAEPITTLGKAVVVRSPLSLRIDGANGQWFAFDQATRQFDGNTPLVLFDFFDEEDGSIGLLAQPLFQVSSMQMTATGSGPVEVALYDPVSRSAQAYEFTVQVGDQITVPAGDEPIQQNGAPLTPAGVSSQGSSLPSLPLLLLLGGALLAVLLLAVAAVVGVVLLSRRRPAGATPPAPAAGGPSGVLTIRQSGGAAEERVLAQPSYRLGRTGDNDLVLSDREVSGHHAQLSWSAQGWRIEDLGSTNGTFLNGQRVNPLVAVVFRPGDVVQVGPFTLQLR